MTQVEMQAQAGAELVGTSIPTLLIFISTCAGNAARRRAIRRSWFQYLNPDTCHGLLAPEQCSSVSCVFIASRGHPELDGEVEQYRDVLLLDAPEGYGHLWRKALVFLSLLVEGVAARDPGHPIARHWPHAQPPAFVMHADDDSYVRLDLLVPRLTAWPTCRHYWGYIWDGTGNRVTAPIRDPRNKSHMPVEQYPLDYYPPFASGCGFALSWDLAAALGHAAATLPDYRLLDPPFGIHLCGDPAVCVVQPPVVPVHCEGVRPYRPLPTFRPDTVVQHYLRPEELAPYHAQAIQSAMAGTHAPSDYGLQPTHGTTDQGERDASSGQNAIQGVEGQPQPTPSSTELENGPAGALYVQLVSLGLLRR